MMNSLRVITFNIHHGKGTDQKVDLQRIADFLQKTNADIIGLNEVDKHFSKRSQFEDQAAFLAEQLNMQFAFGPAISIPEKDHSIDRQYGNALLSKLPIVSMKNHPFDFIPKLLEDRALLEVEVNFGKQPIKIYVTHLSLAPFLHRRQITFLKEKIKNESLPIIVMGDLNMKPYSRGWRELINNSRIIDICEISTHQTFPTYPSTSPKMKLDYILTSSDFYLKAVDVLKDLPHISDHLPLMADVQL